MSKKKKLIREKFRNDVFKRDGYKCKVCNKKDENLDAHHITDRNIIANGGYVKENGISLCEDCHLKAEKWHISKHKEFEEGFHPNDLYELINSNVDLAHSKALELSRLF